MTYKVDTLNLIINIYNNYNKNILKTAKISDISKSSLYKWIKLYNYNFENCIPLIDSDIKLKTIHKLNKQYLYKDKVIDYIKNNIITRKKDILENNNDINISLSTINRIIKNNNYSYKTIKNNISSYDEDIINIKRKNFSQAVEDIDFINAISLDESSFCISDYNNKGYGEKGKIIIRKFKHKRVKLRKTLLSTISKTNVVAYNIFDGALNSNIYMDFLKTNRDNFRGKTIINDNLSIHKSKKILDFCNNENIKLLFIPPYSPETNPIEKYFSEIKRNFRHNNKHEILEDEIKKSINEAKNENLIKYFEHSLKYIKSYLPETNI